MGLFFPLVPHHGAGNCPSPMLSTRQIGFFCSVLVGLPRGDLSVFLAFVEVSAMSET